MLEKINDKIAQGLLFIADCVYANAILIAFVVTLATPFLLMFYLLAGD